MTVTSPWSTLIGGGRVSMVEIMMWYMLLVGSVQLLQLCVQIIHGLEK